MANFERPAWTSLSGSAQDNVPGRFNRVYPVTGSVTDFTGSLWGASAVIVPSGATGTITMEGGSISAADISGLGPVEIGPIQIEQTGGAPIYVLFRNHGVV